MTLLIIDIGSSSVRARLYDDCARPIAGAIRSRAYSFTSDSAGSATADPIALANLVEDCIDQILQHPAAQTIRALGMATFVGNWLGLDEAGEPCTPVITYADTLGSAEIPRLLARLDGDASAYHQATGCRLHPAYLPAQYSQRQRQDPALPARIQRISDIGGYLYRRWFGSETPMSYSVASWSGLLHTRRRDWHWQYARQLLGESIADKLPPLADFDKAQIGLTNEYASRWSRLRDTPFFLALGDGAAANIGSGASDPRHIALTIGTTSALRVVKDIATIPPGLWRYLVSADMPLVGGATSEGGNVYQWVMRDLLKQEESLEAELARQQPDGHGLTVLPLLAGERSPGWQPNASGTIHGLRRGATGLDILQAHLEAVALRLSLIYAQLNPEGASVMAGGGALQASPAWARMIANAFDAPLHILAETEVTARGVALMLRHSLDGLHLADSKPRVSAVIQPEPAAVAAMQGARDRQVELYQRLYA